MTANVESFSGAWPQEASRRSDALGRDADLVRRAQASDQAAFREIVERYKGKVFAIINRTVRDKNEAEDIAQEVFASAFFAIGGFKFESSLVSWLYRITVNECYEYLRRKRVRPLVYEHDFTEAEDGALDARSPDPEIDRTLADRELAMKLLARLPEEEQHLMIMREVEGYSMQELADMTGMNENTLKVKLFRARRKLLELARRQRISTNPRA